jgi:hypothetical protein
MLSQIERLIMDVDGRYASNAELQFFETYAQSYELRLRVYRKLQSAEVAIVQEVYQRLRSLDPTLLMQGEKELSAKWKQDTIRVLRYIAVAVLTADTDTFTERFLLWFQTIMRAFNAQRSCEATYAAMQDVIKKYLSPEELSLVFPVLELTRTRLGAVAA